MRIIIFFFVLTPLREVSVYDYQTGQITELIWGNNNSETKQICKNFKNQINNLDTLFKNKINSDIENSATNISFLNNVTSCLSGINAKLSLFFPFNTNKSDYRIVIKKQSEEIKSVKPYSNRKIGKLLVDKIPTAINDNNDNCPLNFCNGQNEITCRSIIKACNPDNINDSTQQEYCYVDVIKDIPDLELDLNKKYIFWLKYFEKDDNNKDTIEGLLMIVLDESTAEKFEDYCEKMICIKEDNQAQNQNNEIVITQTTQTIPDQQIEKTYNTLKNKIQSFIDTNNNNSNLTATVNDAKQLLTEKNTANIDNNQALQSFISSNNIQ